MLLFCQRCRTCQKLVFAHFHLYSPLQRSLSQKNKDFPCSNLIFKTSKCSRVSHFQKHAMLTVYTKSRKIVVRAPENVFTSFKFPLLNFQTCVGCFGWRFETAWGLSKTRRSGGKMRKRAKKESPTSKRREKKPPQKGKTRDPQKERDDQKVHALRSTPNNMVEWWMVSQTIPSILHS